MASSRFASQKRVPLAGSERPGFSEGSMPHAIMAHAVEHEPEEPITVSVIVKRRAPLDMQAVVEHGHRLTREEYGQQHGADPTSLSTVRAFAAEFGLTVEKQPDTDEHYRTLHLTGTKEQMEKAFAVVLTVQDTQYGKLRTRHGAICVPEELASHIVAVLGLDNRPQAKPHCRAAQPNAASTSFTPVQVAALYGYPSGVKATGQTIALIELGGGYQTSDLTAYFKTLGMAAPKITAVSVDKGTNSPGDPNGADGEVMLDVEVAAAVAPGAAIVVYFAPNTDQGFIDAISTAVHDTKNTPSVISISWGGPESSWTAQSMTALDAACQTAAALGVTITVASGDDGSTDGVTDKANHADFPASSPHVLACGGTKLTGSGSKITSEVAWNELAKNEGATGGGVSNVFALPSWQQGAGVPKPTVSVGGRGVPDVAGNADPATGYIVQVDGKTQTIGGTSAVAPLWAGLIALANAQNKKNAGFINPTLYGSAAKTAFNDITSGSNGGFSAGPGWDACTGLGSPNAPKIVAALAAIPGGSTTTHRDQDGTSAVDTGANPPSQ